MRMISKKITVETNGFAIFDPQLIEDYFHKNILGENILDIFINEDDGEKIIKIGALIPITNIPSQTYNVIIKNKAETISEDKFIFKTISSFPLFVKSSCFISDLYFLLSWDLEKIRNNCDKIPLEKGFYSVSINMFSNRNKYHSNGEAGYIIEFSKKSEIPQLTADLNESMIL